MKLVNLTKTIETALLSGVVIALAVGGALSEQIEKKGKTSYVTHFVFHPLSSIDVPNVGKATVLEAVGPTENMKVEKMLLKSASFCSCGQPENSHTAGILPIGDEFRERIIFRGIEKIIGKRPPQSVGDDEF